MTLVTKKRSLLPYLPFACNFHDTLCFQRPCPPTIGFPTIWYINKRETPKTCLTIHKGLISNHFMPLVINSLGGRYMHIQAYRHRGQKQFQETSRALAFGWRIPDLKFFNLTNQYSNSCNIRMYWCMYVSWCNKYECTNFKFISFHDSSPHSIPLIRDTN